MSARGLIRSTMDRLGLGSLTDWAWKKWLAGDSMEEIMLEMRQTRTYKRRYPAMDQLAKEGRAISEEAYIQFEKTIRGMVRQHGLPMNIYGKSSYIADLLVKDVSAAEAQSRMQLAQAASTTAPVEYRQAAARMYGIKNGQWESIWLETDRTLPELEKQFAAASIAGEATISDLGALSRSMAERLVEAGISREQARQGLAGVSMELGRRLPGEVESGLGTNRLVAGAVGVGTAADQLARRRQQRIARFAGGGGAVTTQQGATGLGSASR